MASVKITGYYGCKCHPFSNWKDCDRAHRQKFEVGDQVKQRCTGRVGKVTQVLEYKYFYHVQYGRLKSDIHLEHSAQLKKQ